MLGRLSQVCRRPAWKAGGPLTRTWAGQARLPGLQPTAAPTGPRKRAYPLPAWAPGITLMTSLSHGRWVRVPVSPPPPLPPGGSFSCYGEPCCGVQWPLSSIGPSGCGLPCILEMSVLQSSQCAAC